METRFYPDNDTFQKARTKNEPIILVVSFNGKHIIAAPLDEAVEHHILLDKCGINSLDIDKYFRVIVDNEDADWTFICPADYKNITDKRRRITAFYNDGFNTISAALAQLEYFVGINIPTRYRRHFDELKG